MRIAMVGTGYVGLVTGACLSEFGNMVTCVDRDQAKIDSLQQGIMTIYEPGLETMVMDNVEQGRLTFTSDLERALRDVDVVFICVGTPSRRGDGFADLSFVFSAAEEIGKYLEKYTVIVLKSTVPIGTAEKVAATIRRVNPRVDFDIVSNPEFLSEGSAIDDFMRPDRVVIGAKSTKATEMMRRLYRPLFLNETPYLETTLQSAELIKYASNAYLATRVAFINEMADLCEKLGGNIQDVSRGMGMDRRIGTKYLQAGPGYGGSSFPKDNRAFIESAQQVGVDLRIVEATVASNDDRKMRMADKIIEACGGTVRGQTIAVLGLTFKPNTDDMREAPSLDIVPALQSQGAFVKAFDPKSSYEAKDLFTDIIWAGDAYEAMMGADCVVIITEWNEFRALDLKHMYEIMGKPVVVDLRNIYRPEEMRQAGFSYYSVGREYSPTGASAKVIQGNFAHAARR
jgi:UDPglucose 6-dehydrogenase